MNIDYFRAAERDIQSLPMLKKSLDMLKKRRDYLIKAGAPKSPGTVDFSKPYVDAHTVNDTLGELLALSEATKQIQIIEPSIFCKIDSLGNSFHISLTNILR